VTAWTISAALAKFERSPWICLYFVPGVTRVEGVKERRGVLYPRGVKDEGPFSIRGGLRSGGAFSKRSPERGRFSCFWRAPRADGTILVNGQNATGDAGITAIEL